MIELYSCFAPNGHKVHIMLEETGLPYRLHPVQIGRGEQFAPEYVALNPNAKIPTIVDTEGPDGTPFTVFETGAVLLYLADKAGRFIPADPAGRSTVIQWLMWQMGGLGPMFGQAQHFHSYAPEHVPYAHERYTREARRLLGVMEARLTERAFLADAYSIADIACFPWIRVHKMAGQALTDFPNVGRWYGTIRQRPAVERGLALLRESWVHPARSAEARKHLFGR